MESQKSSTLSRVEVSLRALEPEDLELIYKVENDTSLWSVGTTNAPYSRFTLSEYITNATGDAFVDRQVRMMICNAEGKSVGMVDLMNFNAQHRRAEIGIVIFERYRHQGFGLAAMFRVFRYAHTVLHIHKLYALVGKTNIYSCRLFDGAGFTEEGTLHDWLFDGDQYQDVIIYQRILPSS